MFPVSCFALVVICSKEAKAKEKAKEDKQKELAKDREKKALVTMCDSAVTKLGAAKTGLGMVMSQPLVGQLSAMISDELKDAHKKIKEIIEEAPLSMRSFISASYET